MKVYFDNASTTPVAPEVIDEINKVLRFNFGNPSSIHAQGREARTLIENARKSIARNLNVSPSEIIFTSGGTEADNHALNAAYVDFGVTTILTSKIEHHAVLHTIEALKQRHQLNVAYVQTNGLGHVDLNHLESLLMANPKACVSLMHANNEIGNLLPMKEVGLLCEKYGAIFHSDTVQTIGHFGMDFQKVNCHMAVCSAHKFHGPKGVGFLYLKGGHKVRPFIQGGSQERNLRGGTENIYGIVGMAMAMELARKDQAQNEAHIRSLKDYFMQAITKAIPAVNFNGDAWGSSLYTILNVQFPPSPNAEMLLFNLDIRGIAASGGSACSSGSNQGSHVLKELGVNQTIQPSIRFSFSKYNTFAEIDYCINKIQEILC